MRSFLAAALVVFGTTTHAANAVDVMQKCEQGERPGELFPAGYCMGYIDGATDAIMNRALGRILFANDPKATLPFCLPNGATLKQLRMVFVKFLSDNPQNLHYPADVQLEIALQKAFPCPPK